MFPGVARHAMIEVVMPSDLPAPTEATAPAPPPNNRFALTGAAIAPGLAAALGITVVATLLGYLAPVIGAPVFAIVIGIVIALVRPPTARLAPGLRFTSKKVLQGSIIVLGLGLSFTQVLRTGAQSMPVLVGSLLGVLFLAWLVGRWLHIPRDTNLLIGVGTAICGASAIAATDAVIDADEVDVSYAVATIFLFNVIAVLLYPTLGHAMGLSQHSFGLWAGTAINDTSSVVAAATTYGQDALNFAVVVKLTRTLLIIPICLGLAALVGRRERQLAVQDTDGGPVDDGPPQPRAKVHALRLVPPFLVGFLVVAAVNSVGLIPAGAHSALSQVSVFLITVALSAIGLSTDLAGLRRTGPRPLVLGALLWLVVALSSLGLQLVTGSL